MKKIKKYYKIIITVLLLSVVIGFCLVIYNNWFRPGVSERLEGIEDHKLTKNEISSVEEKLNELELIDNIDIYTNYKIIKIFLVLKENIKFDKVKKISNESLQLFSEKNLSFYDIEIFVDCLDEESDVYPKIGYKYKTNSEFTWNR